LSRRIFSRAFWCFSPCLLFAQLLTGQTHRAALPNESTPWKRDIVHRLILLDDTVRMEIPEVISTLNTKLDRRQVYGIAAGTSMVVSGIVAAYFKDQANKKFAAYLATGDAAKLDATHSFDKNSNTAFVFTQLSFALLSYILVSD
jgi:hypothetical protein